MDTQVIDGFNNIKQYRFITVINKRLKTPDNDIVPVPHLNAFMFIYN